MVLESITFTGTVMTVVALGNPEALPIAYKLNDGAFQVSNEFDNVPRGINLLTIQDEVGSEFECINDLLAVSLTIVIANHRCGALHN